MICIIGSGPENLSIIKLCQTYAIPYEVIVDTIARPYDDREHNTILERVKKIILQHQEQWAKEYHYIVSPSIELWLSIHDEKFSQTYIVPLFASYLSWCFHNSRSGRLWIIGWYSDLSHIQAYVAQQSQNYQKTEYQTQTKKFIFPFALWTREVPVWNYLLRLLSPRQILVNKIVKEDLKYFKDANVDTIIPLHYSYFTLQRTICSFFNQKKQTFHGRNTLKDIFASCSIDYRDTKLPNHQVTKITIFHTWSIHFIQEKKREYIVSAWGKYTLDYKSIDLK